MNILSYPMRYTTLENEAGSKLYKRDVVFVILTTMFLAFPFIIFDGNFFGVSGLLDRVGTFASVLTGFYIAALVGVASLSPAIGDLDEIIVEGPIFAPSFEYEIDLEGREKKVETKEKLTRRQYVCSLFGYLAFVSLFLSISSIVAVVLSGIVNEETASKIQASIASWVGWDVNWIPTIIELCRAILIIGYALVISHIIATTCHGLYYYIDRIYAKKAEILPDSDNKDV